MKMKEHKLYRQIYTKNWLALRDKIRADDSFRYKAPTIELLLLLQDSVNYRTGEVNITPKKIQDYLDCGKSTSYACLKWFKDNGILLLTDERGEVPIVSDFILWKIWRV